VQPAGTRAARAGPHALDGRGSVLGRGGSRRGRTAGLRVLVSVPGALRRERIRVRTYRFAEMAP
jgi:hypothetical protein